MGYMWVSIAELVVEWVTVGDIFIISAGVGGGWPHWYAHACICNSSNTEKTVLLCSCLPWLVMGYTVEHRFWWGSKIEINVNTVFEQACVTHEGWAAFGMDADIDLLDMWCSVLPPTIVQLTAFYPQLVRRWETVSSGYTDWGALPLWGRRDAAPLTRKSNRWALQWEECTFVCTRRTLVPQRGTQRCKTDKKKKIHFPCSESLEGWPTMKIQRQIPSLTFNTMPNHNKYRLYSTMARLWRTLKDKTLDAPCLMNLV